MIGSDYVIIWLYMDDMLIFGTNVSVVNETKRLLSSLFEMQDLGEADVILGIKLSKTKSGFSLCRSHYIEKMLKDLILVMWYLWELHLIIVFILRRIEDTVCLNLNMQK